VSDTPKGRFPKSEHLRKHSDFQRVYKQGRRHFSGIMTVFYLQSQGGSPQAGEEPPGGTAAVVRVGFTVPRALGDAVDRNRMRRRTREAVRRHLAILRGLGALDVVINPKKTLLAADFELIDREVERAFGVIRRGCQAQTSPRISKSPGDGGSARGTKKQEGAGS
jgi:ribonuclease P protein component